MDVAVFYTVLKDIHSEFDKKRQAIQFDTELSQEGKAKRLARIDENRQKAVSQLQESFETAYNKELAILDTKLNGKKESAKDKAKAYMDTQLVKDFNLSTYHDGSPILDDNSRTALVLSELQGLRKDFNDNILLQSLSQMSESDYRDELSTGQENKDVERLGVLRKSLDYSPNRKLARTLKGEFDAVINKLKLDVLSPEQRQAMSERESLQRDKELLDYSFANILQRGEYVDVRQVNTEPTTVLKYVGGSGRVTQNKV